MQTVAPVRRLLHRPHLLPKAEARRAVPGKRQLKSNLR